MIIRERTWLHTEHKVITIIFYVVGVHTEKFDYYIFIPYSGKISRDPIFTVSQISA